MPPATSQKAFDQFFSSLMWECAYVRESHFVVAHWQAPNGASFKEQPILRVLFMLPCELANQALEFIAYDVANYSMAEWLDDSVPVGTIKRRQAEVVFGPVNIKAACVGYRWVDNISTERSQFFTQEGYFDEQGRIIEPYNIDWPSAMDNPSEPAAEKEALGER
jgi:hypothetical protein